MPTRRASPPARRWAPTPDASPVLDLVVQKASYFGFIAFLALCGLGLPIPEEAPLVLAGVLSSNGTLEHPTWAFGACLLGALLGDSIMYFIGRRLGHGYLMKHPRFARFIDPEREEKFEHIVTRHGFKLVLLTRFLIGVRGPVYFAAGAARVPYWRFLMWDFFAASIVVSVVFGLGYYYGQSIEELIRKAENILTIVVVAVVAIALFVGFFHRRMKAALEHLAEEVEEEAEEAAEAKPVLSAHNPDEPDNQPEQDVEIDQQSA
ncbi:MAG: DedA family protein [Planctomycetota bacterium]